MKDVIINRGETLFNNSGIAEKRDQVENFLSHEYIMGLLTVVPAATMFTLIVLGPILWAFGAAFYSIPTLSPEWEFVGLANFREILNDPEFHSAFFTNIVFAVGTTLFNTAMGVGVALLLNRDFKFKKYIFPIGLLPYLIPTVFVSYIAIWITSQQWGILNQILLQLGIITEDSLIAWFNEPARAMGGLIFTHNWKFSFFVTILVLARLKSIPDDLYEAAETCGASLYQQFRDITLPNIKNVLFIVILLRGTWNFNKFDIIWTLTNGGPGNTTTTVPIYAYLQAFELQQLGKAAATSVFLFLFLSVIAVIYFRTAEPSKEVRVE
jgi:multiple sugar transport system permease protein